MKRAEIIVSGKVQGVGFRYFVLRNAESLDLKGYTENLDDGSVRTVAEGERDRIEALYEKIRQGPERSRVEKPSISWQEYTNEFDGFTIRRG